jgi:hypothetical protein
MPFGMCPNMAGNAEGKNPRPEKVFSTESGQAAGWRRWGPRRHSEQRLSWGRKSEISGGRFQKG